MEDFGLKDVTFSFVIIAYQMQREIIRTLQSLSRRYQREVDEIDYEIILVDNGSDTRLDLSGVHNDEVPFRFFYRENASVSPSEAINFGVAQASGKYVAIMIDGARMLSPGVIKKAHDAIKLAKQPVVSVLGLHLGPGHQRITVEQGYNKAVEDKLLDSIDWYNDGYRLFEISSWGGSSPCGWLGPIAESNCIILSKTLFHGLDGYDEGFKSPGGGLVNLDFYKRAVESEGVQSVYLFGEGCFHQLHGGVTTGSKSGGYTFNQLNEEYIQLRGEGFIMPKVASLLYGEAQPNIAPVMLQAINNMMEKGDMLSVEELCRPFLSKC